MSHSQAENNSACFPSMRDNINTMPALLRKQRCKHLEDNPALIAYNTLKVKLKAI